jgi:hypothetical protein
MSASELRAQIDKLKLKKAYLEAVAGTVAASQTKPGRKQSKTEQREAEEQAALQKVVQGKLAIFRVQFDQDIATCAMLYQQTADLKNSDITVRQQEQIAACRKYNINSWMPFPELATYANLYADHYESPYK